MAVPTTEKPLLAGPSRPLGAPEIPQYYLPSSSGKGTYAPRLYGAAAIQFGTKRQRIDERRRVAFLVPITADTKAVDWEHARPTSVMPDGLVKSAPAGATYLPLPARAMALKDFTRWAKQFDRWLARTQKLDIAPATDGSAGASLGPKRGGVTVELVAIVWELQ